MRSEWSNFYGELADNLGRFSPESLFEKIRSLAQGNSFFDYFHFDNESHWQSRGPRLDPFSVMATFNRGQTDEHRARIAELLARDFTVSEPVPDCYHGIPFVDPRRSIFDGDAQMWALYHACLTGPQTPEFAEAYDNAKEVHGNALGNLSIALFWVRPAQFMAIDRLSEPRIRELTGLEAPGDKCSGAEYAQFLAKLKSAMKGRTFPQLAYAAWQQAHPGQEGQC